MTLQAQYEVAKRRIDQTPVAYGGRNRGRHVEAADQMSYSSSAVHDIVGDLCHALGLAESDVAEIHIYPGKVEAKIREKERRSETKDVAYSYPVGS